MSKAISTNLMDYAKIYKNAIPQDVSDEILKNLRDIEYHQHTFYNYKTNEDHAISGDKELDVSFSDNYRNEQLEKIIWDIIYHYIGSLDMSWFSGWQGFSLPRWNKYKETRQMALHADRIKSLFDGERKGDPTLTVLGLFRTEFTGGEFIMWEDGNKLDYDPGDIIVFPSNFMYPHKVEPVTKGTRYSYISWVW